MSTDTETYELQVRGHLDPHWAILLGCPDLTHHLDGTTRLRTGPIDQAQLHGTLTLLRDGGVTLMMLRAGAGASGACGSSP